MCFRYEKQSSNFASCLERAESASKPDSQHLSADKVKLHTEIQDMQVCLLAIPCIHFAPVWDVVNPQIVTNR